MDSAAVYNPEARETQLLRAVHRHHLDHDEATLSVLSAVSGVKVGGNLQVLFEP